VACMDGKVHPPPSSPCNRNQLPFGHSFSDQVPNKASPLMLQCWAANSATT
jgi:hypothetical protein